jgi:hypothetical protein
MNEGAALQQLRDILARPEFERAAQRSVWERLWHAAGDLLYNLLLRFLRPQLTAAGSVPIDWVRVAIWAAAVALLVGGTLFAVQAVRLNVVGDARLRGERAQRRRRSDEYWRQAQTLAAGGAYTEAIVPLYLSALYALDEHGALRVQEALTNREHARRIAREQPAVGEPFAALVERYDRLRYGGHAVDADLFGQLSGLAAQTRGGPVSSTGEMAGEQGAARGR